jgi:hypothetical protein
MQDMGALYSCRLERGLHENVVTQTNEDTEKGHTLLSALRWTSTGAVFKPGSRQVHSS